MIYRWRHGRWPELDAPQRFTEWVQWRKLNDRRHDARAADRQGACQGGGASAAGADLVIPTLWLGERLPEIAPWPMPFIVKANHGCGQFVVVRDRRRLCDAHGRSHRCGWRDAYGGWLDEWHYRAARRLLLVEPYIGGTVLPLDYKVYVFGGRAALVQLHVGRGRRHRWTQYRPRLDAVVGRSDDRAARRRGWPSMLAAAEAVARARGFPAGRFLLRAGRAQVRGISAFIRAPGSIRSRPTALDVALGARWAASIGAHHLMDQVDRFQRSDHDLERWRCAGDRR